MAILLPGTVTHARCAQEALPWPLWLQVSSQCPGTALYVSWSFQSITQSSVPSLGLLSTHVAFPDLSRGTKNGLTASSFPLSFHLQDSSNSLSQSTEDALSLVLWVCLKSWAPKQRFRHFPAGRSHRFSRSIAGSAQVTDLSLFAWDCPGFNTQSATSRQTVTMGHSTHYLKVGLHAVQIVIIYTCCFGGDLYLFLITKEVHFCWTGNFILCSFFFVKVWKAALGLSTFSFKKSFIFSNCSNNTCWYFRREGEEGI